MKEYTILGKLPSKFLYDKWEDKSITIISMNDHYDSFLIPRVDLWFDIHQKPQNTKADYNKSNFPFKECQQLVKGNRFCCTMSYMIAWCILQGAEKINIYGAKFIDDGNMRRQRELQNVRQLLFFCLGKGIELEICEDDKEYLFPEYIIEEGEDFDQ